jgi:hypothetical protein
MITNQKKIRKEIPKNYLQMKNFLLFKVCLNSITGGQPSHGIFY